MKKFVLTDKELPEQWYNTLPDLPEPLPGYLHPVTHEPLKPADLEGLLPRAVIEQEFATERWIDIPEQVRDVYRIWRPTPLYRAERLERELDTPARIYFKYEAVSPPGSHKPNTAIPQVYYNAQEGVRRVTTETGAGQWGSALSFAGSLFGLDVTVYMVVASYQQKPYRRLLMQNWGAEVFASPTDRTQAGRNILAKDPDSPGSLGIAISEAVEDALAHEDTRFALGSAMNHVVLHQTVLGLEAKRQMEMVGDYPDVIVGCVGIQLLRTGLPVHGRPALRCAPAHPVRRCGAHGLPDSDPGQLHLRPSRYSPARPDAVHAYCRPWLHPSADPRGRAAFPRRRAHVVPAAQPGLRRGAGLPPDRDLR